MTRAARLSAVEKRYPGFRLGPIDLSIEAGTALALIGPNGAGKTTLMDLLAGLLRPTSGRVEVLGRAPSRDGSWKADVGYASERQSFYENWSTRRNLEFLARFFPTWSADLEVALVRRFDLPLEKKVRTLSSGNRVKLALVAALARRPRLLLLDEPTAGLDPLVRAEVLDVLWEFLKGEAPTIMYSTHRLADVSRLADELVFIRHGRLLLRAPRDDLEGNWRLITFRLEAGRLSGATERLLLDHQVQGSRHRAVSFDFERASDQLRALGVTQIEASRLQLEEIAVHILKADPSALADWAGVGVLGSGGTRAGGEGSHVASL